jgi:hypothetical protein
MDGSQGHSFDVEKQGKIFVSYIKPRERLVYAWWDDKWKYYVTTFIPKRFLGHEQSCAIGSASLCSRTLKYMTESLVLVPVMQWSYGWHITKSGSCLRYWGPPGHLTKNIALPSYIILTYLLTYLLTLLTYLPYCDWDRRKKCGNESGSENRT